MKLLTAAVSLTLVAGALTSPAGGAEDPIPSLAAELASLSQTSTEEILTSATNAAKNAGKPVYVVLTSARNEIVADLSQAKSTTRNSNGPNLASEALPSARRPGDLFYSDSHTLGANHGHIGIYLTNDTIVEANTSGVVRASAASTKVSKGAQIMTVNVANDHQASEAANWADSKVGQGYNWNFPFNRTHNPPYNCSQLVWASYGATMGIDLDYDRGHGVYPRDIVRSHLTTTYQTV